MSRTYNVFYDSDWIEEIRAENDAEAYKKACSNWDGYRMYDPRLVYVEEVECKNITLTTGRGDGDGDGEGYGNGEGIME